MAQRAKTKKICPVCGKEFVTDKNAKKFCSKRCRKKASYTPKPMMVKHLKCDWCDKEFLSERRRKYCCEDCRRYANGRLTKRKAKPKNVMSIEEVAKLSREASMSYGEYVMKYGL